MADANKRKASSRGVAFSGDPMRERASSRVHFDDKLHDSVITVAAEDDGSFLVKVGFLKLQHRYEMAFTLPELPSLGENVCLAPVSSPHLRVVDISPAPEGDARSRSLLGSLSDAALSPTGGLRLTCEYLAQEAGVLCERLRLLSRPDRDAGVTVKVHARVMERGHGTPMLLEGVRCIGVELEYDSEQSDWQGFD
ncbi:adipose-secreted signaling protein isoform X3 [Stigmatopora argus]